MALKTFKDVIVVLDTAAGATSRITAFCNNFSIASTLSKLEKSAFGDSNRTFLTGLSGATLTINGWINSTTGGIFGPLTGQRTTVTKTFGIYDGVKWYKGEAWVDPTISGAVDELQTFSADLTVDGAVTYNSTAPA